MGQIEREGPMQSESRGVAFQCQWYRSHHSAQYHVKVAETQAASIEVHYETEKKKTQDENSPGFKALGFSCEIIGGLCNHTARFISGKRVPVATRK